ncbi:hypothetical protein IFM46972_02055 [Aspergillus udagawae]|uniref:Uncharacterized protein n=1 Tax=Aspergillus udagawae TaxID=91492 RepID=A0A8H3NDJ5_9EURO|nr:hypothetical protein IFM46972_02055 [Aspergillus udagawae]
MPNISLSRAISPKGWVRIGVQTPQSNRWPRGFQTGQMRNIPDPKTTKNDAKIPQPPPDKESPSARPVAVDSKGREYHSLKEYREGPNPESGELGKEYNSEDVRTHNKDVDERHKKD